MIANYELVAVYADDQNGELRCLEHSIPWRADEGVWFEGPQAAG